MIQDIKYKCLLYYLCQKVENNDSNMPLSSNPE